MTMSKTLRFRTCPPRQWSVPDFQAARTLQRRSFPREEVPTKVSAPAWLGDVSSRQLRNTGTCFRSSAHQGRAPSGAMRCGRARCREDTSPSQPAQATAKPLSIQLARLPTRTFSFVICFSLELLNSSNNCACAYRICGHHAAESARTTRVSPRQLADTT